MAALGSLPTLTLFYAWNCLYETKCADNKSLHFYLQLDVILL